VHTGPFAGEWSGRLDDEAQTALDQARTIVDDATTLLLRGRAADAFLRAVSDQKATLAVLGSHDTSRAAGFLIGSVATRALHESPCSVLVARTAEQPWPRTIIVGVDGSESSFAAAEVAHDVATRVGATMRLVVARGATQDDLATDALTTVGHELAFSEQKPVPALLEAAQEADLIVVGSRGITGLRALGSVSERVPHHARCSLLVIRGV